MLVGAAPGCCLAMCTVGLGCWCCCRVLLPDVWHVLPRGRGRDIDCGIREQTPSSNVLSR